MMNLGLVNDLWLLREVLSLMMELFWECNMSACFIRCKLKIVHIAFCPYAETEEIFKFSIFICIWEQMRRQTDRHTDGLTDKLKLENPSCVLGKKVLNYLLHESIWFSKPSIVCTFLFLGQKRPPMQRCFRSLNPFRDALPSRGKMKVKTLFPGRLSEWKQLFKHVMALTTLLIVLLNFGSAPFYVQSRDFS